MTFLSKNANDASTFFKNVFFGDKNNFEKVFLREIIEYTLGKGEDLTYVNAIKAGSPWLMDVSRKKMDGFESGFYLPRGVVQEACVKGDWKVLKRLQEDGYNADNDNLLALIENGHFQLLRNLFKEVDEDMESFYTTCLNTAIKNGHSIIEYWLKDKKKASYNDYTYVAAAAAGNTDLMEYMQLQYGYDHEYFDEKAGNEAVIYGHYNVLEWMIRNEKMGVASFALISVTYEVLHKGDLKMLMWLEERLNVIKNCNVKCLSAANFGYLHILKWVKEKYGMYDGSADNNCGVSYECAEAAAESGRLNVLKWLKNDCGVRLYGLHVSLALYSGHLNVLKWLKDDCNLNVCIIRTGFADEFDETDEDDAAEIATKKGYLHILKWLKEECGMRFGELHLQIALNYEHFEVYQWLIEECGWGSSDGSSDGSE